ncbi:hypothetical protein [Fluviicola taffensis]|uniref:Uncharacterized protein n=1 Tax=Fluviicola taffensis (strain DSM 16823 / NCIMB 13979 / RW262) TaxID=755732 RepID=F2IHR0_FLUTR|nr:hypothetical protein [Fluviicola taffensis]AEA44838.1 hypothetical protein Fluta_2859 [Fluviicola taffensis DSM 16823]
MDKKNLFNHISKIVQEKIDRLQADISDLQKDIAEDSKSSAGDKFETAREMAQQELSKLSVQLSEQQRLKGFIESLSQEESDIVKIGSLVQTDKGHFLVGVPIGKISFNQLEITGIGAAAPLGQVLLKKQINDCIQINQQSFLIEQIL